MDYKIVQQDTMTFTGFSKEFSTKDGKNFEEIPKFWQMLFQTGKHGMLLPMQDELGTVGISYHWSEANHSFNYMVGVRSDVLQPETNTLTLKPSMYAVFTAIGACPKSLQNTIKYCHNVFLPSGNYRHTGGPEIEVYPPGDTSSDEYICYYWIPVVQR